MISLFAPYGEQFAVFNIADSCLSVGVVLAVLLELTGRQRDGMPDPQGRTEDDEGISVTTRSLPVPDGLDGMRLDQAVSRLFGLSRTAAASLVEAGDAMVDGVPRPKSDKVAAGAWLEVTLPAAGRRAGDRGRAGARHDDRVQRRRHRGGGQAGRRGRAPEPGLDRPDRASAGSPRWARTSRPAAPPSGRASCTASTSAPPG